MSSLYVYFCVFYILQQETARRPKSALRKRGSGLSVSIAASVMAETDEAKDMTYCLRFLCEHEEVLIMLFYCA